MRIFRRFLTFPINFIIVFITFTIGISAIYLLFFNPPKIEYIPKPTPTKTSSPIPTQVPTPIPTKPPKSVVFLGGSITAGAGATNYNYSWASLLSSAINRKFPDYAWSFYNAGVGGTPSWYGLMRLQTDVIDKNPDIVFIDFAVNDSEYQLNPPPGNSDYFPAAEALIRRIRSSLPNTQIYIWIFTYPDNYSTMNENRRASRDIWISLAEHYDLSLLRFDEAIQQEIGTNEPNDQQIDQYFSMPGNVHPNDLGYELAARYAEEHLILPNQLQLKPINEYSYLLNGTNNFENRPIIINGQDLQPNNDWVLDGETIKSTLSNAEIIYSDELCFFGLDTNYGINAGKISWSIDHSEGIIRDLSLDDIGIHPITTLVCGIHSITIKIFEGEVQIKRFLLIIP